MSYKDSLKYKDAKFKIGEEEWTAKYRPTLQSNGSYVKAIRVPEKKEIYMSIFTDKHTKYSEAELSVNFQKAILPDIIAMTKIKYDSELVDKVIDKLQNSNK